MATQMTREETHEHIRSVAAQYPGEFFYDVVEGEKWLGLVGGSTPTEAISKATELANHFGVTKYTMERFHPENSPNKE